MLAIIFFQYYQKGTSEKGQRIKMTTWERTGSVYFLERVLNTASQLDAQSLQFSFLFQKNSSFLLRFQP
jgi:hypothetical protein